MDVSRSGYYAWQARQGVIGQREQANQQLLEQIRAVHMQHRQAYGALKTWERLNQMGIACGKHRIAKLRKQAGIEARRKARLRVTARHHKLPAPAPDRLQRQFTASVPNSVWVGDMTFIRTRQGWLHLAILLDLFSRKVVGWAFNAKPNSELHEAALTMAIKQRKPPKGLIHHTDRGSVYSAVSYRRILRHAGMVQSMNGKKTAYDNAVAESFFSSLKNEWVHHHDFKTREEAQVAIFDYIECFYNTQRIHQSLGYLTPVEKERMYYTNLKC